VPSLQYEKTDFLLGVEGKNECIHTENETEIGAREDECKDAARIVGAHVDVESVFRIGDEVADYDLTMIYPIGCFYKKCVPHGAAAGSSEIDCFFFNMGDQSLSNDSHPDFSGTPVCWRAKYVDGAAHKQGCLDPDYKVVDSEGECRKQCGYGQYAGCTDDDFMIEDAKNFTRHHDFPKGCFHLETAEENAMNTVFYNNYPEANEVDGSEVSGTPICKVKNPLQLSEWTAPAPPAPAPVPAPVPLPAPVQDGEDGGR
jgi:hypothetical protein